MPQKILQRYKLTQFLAIAAKEYLSRIAARDETEAEKRNLGQMCHAVVCRCTEPAESTMPVISLELSDTESRNFTHI